MLVRFISLITIVLLLAPRLALAADWSEEQIPKLPAGEKAVKLFNGQDLTGWEGHTDKYYSVVDGVIVGKNSKETAPKSSTYLLTKQKFRDFRLIFESKLVTSEMHSGIALWGKAITKETGPFTYQGHLVMYPSGYGYYDLFRRNSIYADPLGVAKRAGVQHDWNKMEILATGHRIRHVVNGHLVADWSDPMPELCESGPIGLQLHSNTVPQEVQWRGLILTENPQDQLVTATSKDLGLFVDGKPAESGMDAEALKKIDEKLKEFEQSKQFAGAVTLVARRGRIVHHAATGKADLSGRDMAKDTVFAIASMTKPITAAAVLILQDEGKLKLDDPVSKYIPAFKETKLADGSAPAREMTIRDCLRHTNGLVSDQKNMGTLANTADELAKTKLAFAPGTKWQYGPGLSVAGRVVEIVSGQSFDQFLSKRIFQPLEMNETSFHPTPEQLKRLAILYQPTADKKDLEPGKHWLFDVTSDSSPNPSGGLYSTATDLAKFYQMILNGGELSTATGRAMFEGKRILSADAVKEMTSLQTKELATTAPGVTWGLGFSLMGQPAAGSTPQYWAYGHGGAFGTNGTIDPQRELIVVFLIARQNFTGGPDVRGEIQKLAVEAVRN